MALVGYSDSEDSDNEQPVAPVTKPNPKANTSQSKFSVDRADPTKIRVNLSSLPAPTSHAESDEPAAKRPRVGAGTFSGFNAMLPAPKRDNLPVKPQNGGKQSTRKVFSLKTGAEPAFSRESDAELRQLFAEQAEISRNQEEMDTTIPSVIPKVQTTNDDVQPIATSKPFIFKPLSVARNNKKKKPALSHPQAPAQNTVKAAPTQPIIPDQPVEKKKVSLFSAENDEIPSNGSVHDEEEDDEIVEILPDDDTLNSYHDTFNTSSAINDRTNHNNSGAGALETIATDLNLSAADRRQLFGRQKGAKSSMPSNIINFNTDLEYAANQEMIAAGEQVQHNPVRAIAPGKHSLKQLVASAQGQKEALEESFAAGKRNKREAGSKYGW